MAKTQPKKKIERAKPVTKHPTIISADKTHVVGNVVQVDMVNHPPHYGAHPSGVECVTITEHYNFNVGNAIKYLWRAGLKGDATTEVEDFKKACWYIQREIDKRTREADDGTEGADRTAVR